ncbi:MAG: ABC transporter substrate-binding protein [Chloroflexi bacterium]|nr:ABC transporter substrate-binding protein [Chloroflexota bacterium]
MGAIKVINLAPMWVLPEIAKKYNVEVEVVEFQRFADVRTALIAREIDFGAFGPQDISLAMASGATNLVGLAGAGVGNDTVIIRKGVEVKDWKDLKGLRVGIGAGSISWVKFVASIAERPDEIRYSDLKIVNIAGGGENYVAAIERGDIDVAVLWEPFSAQAVSKGVAYYPPFSHNESKAVGGTFAIFATNRETVQSRPEVVLRMVTAYVDAMEQLRSNREFWYQRASQYSGLPIEVVKLSIEGSKSQLDYAIPLEKIVNMTKFLYENGVITTDVSSRVPSAYDYSFLSRVTGKSPKDLGSPS